MTRKLKNISKFGIGNKMPYGIVFVQIETWNGVDTDTCIISEPIQFANSPISVAIQISGKESHNKESYTDCFWTRSILKLHLLKPRLRYLGYLKQCFLDS